MMKPAQNGISVTDSLDKSTALNAFSTAVATIFNVWNMDCPECAQCLRLGLSTLNGVLKVDIFYEQGIAVVIYDPDLTSAEDLLQAVRTIGEEECRFYGAEIIGHCPAMQAVRS
jgi:copper chaperone CopZ